jgi:hypothetical protein
MGGLSVWHWLIFFVFMLFIPALLSGLLARRRHRSVVLWVALSLVSGIVFVGFGYIPLIVLFFLGPAERTSSTSIGDSRLGQASTQPQMEFGLTAEQFNDLDPADEELMRKLFSTRAS